MSWFKSKTDRANDLGIATALMIVEYAVSAVPVLFERASVSAGEPSESPTSHAEATTTLCGVLAYLAGRGVEARYGPKELAAYRDSLGFTLGLRIAEVAHGVHTDVSARATTAAKTSADLDLIASRLAGISDMKSMLIDGSVQIAESVLRKDVAANVKSAFSMQCAHAIASGVDRLAQLR